MDRVVDRPPLDPEALQQEISDVFSFWNSGTPTPAQYQACRQIESGCQMLAHRVADLVPEGKEQTIAINNLLGVALWARHGILRRQVSVVTVAPPLPGSPAAPPA